MSGFVSGLPYTDAEREADAQGQHEAQIVVLNRRKACRSGQDYNQPGTAASRAKDRRVMGERD